MFQFTLRQRVIRRQQVLLPPLPHRQVRPSKRPIQTTSGLPANPHQLHESSYSAHWSTRLAPYIDFGEAERELSFQHVIKVEYADVAESLAEGSQDLEASFDAETLDYYTELGEVTSILGLTEPGVNFWDEATSTRSASAAAYYDPVDEVIVLPAEGSFDLELSIVHELTYALQHQNGLLDTEVFTDDQATMNLALTEGDATRIERIWFAQMSAMDQEAINTGYAAMQSVSDPYNKPNSYFETTFAIPYILGEHAVESLIRAGGLDALNEVIRDPNLTTEMMVDPFTTSPRSMFKGVRYTLVTAPEEAELGARSVLGPSTLYLTLVPGLGAADTIEALDGYEADIYETWSMNGVSCLDLHV